MNAVAEALRAADRDRYLTTLYAPEEPRTALTALYAFNAEVAGIRDRIREALPGEVRLQWWRDAILAANGDAASGHPVAEALRAAIASHSLPTTAFENYLDARVFDLYNDPMPTRSDLEGYCGETASTLIQLSAIILDTSAAPAHAELSGRAGCAMGITGLLRLLPLHRARGQCFVPKDILSACGSSPEELLSAGGGPHAARVVEAMIALAREHLVAFELGAPALPQTLRPSFLPVAPCRPLLDRMEKAGPKILDTPVALPEWRRQWILFRHAAKGWR
jgi:phytoene synthase